MTASRSWVGIALMAGGLGLALAACGGGGTDASPPPPPPPVVTTVEVTPGAPALSEGDSVQLSATVRDQRGAPVSGKTVIWASSAVTTATVSATGLVSAVASGTATITASVDGKSGSDLVTVAALPRIAIDPSKAATASIGPSGGSVTTTSGGATLTLTVPAGALLNSTPIVMTPVTALRKLPASGEFVAAVKFEPDGLQFLKPATLKIVAHVPPVGGKKLVGYLANDTGAVITFAPATQQGDTLTLQMPHFTVGGWGQFVQGQIPLTPLLPVSIPSQNADDQTYAAEAAGAPIPTHVKIFQDWYTKTVEPELLGASSQAAFEAAAEDFSVWDAENHTIDDGNSFGGALVSALATERQRGVSLLPRVLKGAISGRNASCAAVTSFSLIDAEVVFLLQDEAQQFGIDTPANGLDTKTIVSTLCLKVINTIANFPVNPSPNAPAQLDLRYGVLFGTSVQAQSMLMKVTVTLRGTTTDGVQVAQTDLQGALSGTVTPTGSQDFTADMKACIHPSLGYRLDEVCLSHTVTRPFGITISDVLVTTEAGLQSLGNVAKITGNLTIVGSDITSTDLSELASLKRVDGTIKVFSLPNLRTLRGFSKLNSSPAALDLESLPLLTDISDLHGVTSLSGFLNFRDLPLLGDLTGLDNVASVGVLTVANLPLLTTIAPLGQAVIHDGIDIEKTGLITLTQLPKANGSLTASIVITDNPHLTDLAPLSTVRSTASLVISNNAALGSLADLSGLQGATDAVEIEGPALSGVALPGLLSAGSILMSLADLPHAGLVTFPSLVTVTGDVQIFEAFPGLPPCTTGPSSVSMPELRSVGNLLVQGTGVGVSNCTFDLSLPKLGTVTGDGQSGHGLEIFAQGPRDIVLGSVTITDTRRRGITFGVTSSGTVRHITTGTINVPHGSLLIDGLTALTSLVGGGGTIGANLLISGNSPISLQTLQAWAAAFTVLGTKTIN